MAWDKLSWLQRLWRRIAMQSLPYWLLVVVILGVTVGAIVIAADTSADDHFGKVLQSKVIPILTLVAGGLFNDLYHRLGEDRHLVSDVKKSTYASLSLLQNAMVVEQHLALAANKLEEENIQDAESSIRVGLAMITASLRQVVQNLRLWESLSPKGAEQARAEFKADDALLKPPARQEIDVVQNRQGAQ